MLNVRGFLGFGSIDRPDKKKAPELPPKREPEPSLTIRKGVRWQFSQMLSSRLRNIHSFDAAAMVAVGIIVVQLMLG